MHHQIPFVTNFSLTLLNIIRSPFSKTDTKPFGKAFKRKSHDCTMLTELEKQIAEVGKKQLARKSFDD